MWSIADLLANTLAFVVIEEEVGETPRLSGAFACARATVQLRAWWTFEMRWADTAAFGFTENLQALACGLVGGADAFAQGAIENVVRGTGMWCYRALTLAGFGVDSLVWGTAVRRFGADASTRFWIQLLIGPTFGVVRAHTLAVVGVVVLWAGTRLGIWAFALAHVCIEDLSWEGTLFGYIGTFALASFPVKHLCFVTLGCMRTDTLACLFVKNLCSCASRYIRTDALAL